MRPDRLRSFSTRFAAITELGARITCRERSPSCSSRRRKARSPALTAKDETGDVKLVRRSDRQSLTRTQRMNNLAGKVALVSGSGRGIGRPIALKLARHGAKVVVNDLDEAPGKAVADEIKALGGEAVAVNGDVTKPGFAESFVSAANGEIGRARHHRQQRRLHLGFDRPEDDRRAVSGHARRASGGAVPHHARGRRADPHSRQEGRRSGTRSVPQGRQHLVSRGPLRQCRAGRAIRRRRPR